MLKVVVYGGSGLLVVGSFLLVIYFQETKLYIDLYANHATVIGLLLGLAGFALTIWTLFEGLRISRQSQEQVRSRVEDYRLQVDDLLDHVRLQAFRDTCAHAYASASDAKHAIRANLKLRAVEKTEDARRYALRILPSPDLVESEKISLRAIVEELRATASFLETKVQGPQALKVPPRKSEPLDLLCDELDRICSRLTIHSMETLHAK